jgi:hypothetical protein
MLCQNCQRPMRALLLSLACDYCDGQGDAFDFRGFVVLRKDRTLPCEEYVFATRADAERWRELNGLYDAEIREVRGDKPFRWQPSRGTVRGIILADRLFEIWPERDFVPKPNRAVLAA